MKLKLKWIITFLSIICVMCGSVSAYNVTTSPWSITSNISTSKDQVRSAGAGTPVGMSLSVTRNLQNNDSINFTSPINVNGHYHTGYYSVSGSGSFDTNSYSNNVHLTHQLNIITQGDLIFSQPFTYNWGLGIGSYSSDGNHPHHEGSYYYTEAYQLTGKSIDVNNSVYLGFKPFYFCYYQSKSASGSRTIKINAETLNISAPMTFNNSTQSYLARFSGTSGDVYINGPWEFAYSGTTTYGGAGWHYVSSTQSSWRYYTSSWDTTGISVSAPILSSGTCTITAPELTIGSTVSSNMGYMYLTTSTNTQLHKTVDAPNSRIQWRTGGFSGTSGHNLKGASLDLVASKDVTLTSGAFTLQSSNSVSAPSITLNSERITSNSGTWNIPTKLTSSGTSLNTGTSTYTVGSSAFSNSIVVAGSYSSVNETKANDSTITLSGNFSPKSLVCNNTAITAQGAINNTNHIEYVGRNLTVNGTSNVTINTGSNKIEGATISTPNTAWNVTAPITLSRVNMSATNLTIPSCTNVTASVITLSGNANLPNVNLSGSSITASGNISLGSPVLGDSQNFNSQTLNITNIKELRGHSIAANHVNVNSIENLTNLKLSSKTTATIPTYSLETTDNTVSILRTVFNSGANFSCDKAPIILDGVSSRDTFTVSNSTDCTVNGGQFSGNPAIRGDNVVVNKGTFTDLNGSASLFLIGSDSESTTVKDGSTTITTVKLSNPPVIIDWADFPGIDLSVDLSAPVIEVIRTPGDSRTPTDKVTLQIGAVDPSGLKDKETGEEVKEAYVSINGGKFTQVFEGQYIQYDVTENQTVSITARDANGNVRDYNVVISNIDERPPEVKGFEQSTDNWTKGTVRVYVNAEDDVKLDPNGAYRYTFTPTDGGTAITTDWTRDRFYTTDKNGTLVVEVRDAVGKTTTSDSWLVSNIDIIAPDFTVELTPDASIKASEKDGVLLTINPNNLADPVTQEASPLANLAVKWDPAEPWSSDFERMVYENGVYNIQIRDSVGNVSNVKPITVSNISDQKPRITSFVGDNLAAAFVPGPVVLTVNAESSDGTPLPDRPYSWDGGKTWTSQNTLSVSYNGEYEVTVRDGVGNTVSDYCLVKNIDSVKPTANVYLYKGQPSDWAGPDPATIDDYVWKIRIDTEDIGSGVAMVKTLWNNGAYTTNTTGLTFDVVEAGVFGVLVYDKAGNETYAEKTVTWESIGESAGGSNSNAYVGISAPSTGTAGSPFEDGTSIADVVYGPDGAYNKKTGEFKPYTPGQEGIVVDLIANSKTNKWISGYATFEGVNYPIKFKDAAGNYVEGPVKGGKNMPCRVYIPVSGITKDVKNGRLVTVFQEWDDAAGTQLNREGSETLYTSVQVNPPYIQWSYDKTTGELTISPNSPVAGIPDDGIKYALDGGAEQGYTGPFIIPDGTSVIDVRVVDNAGNETTLHLDTSKLPVSGSGGGNLPTEGADGATGAGGGAVNSYYMAGRTSESYIIGGTRNNTNSIPSSDVFSSIVGSTP